MTRIRLFIPVLALLMPAAGCTRNGPATGHPPATTNAAVLRLPGMPHVLQKPDFCGEACAEMVLRHRGSDLTQDDVFALSRLDPVKGRGCYTRELVTALKAVGFSPGTTWFTIRPKEAHKELAALLDAMVADLRRGIPSICCMRTRGGTEHFRLVVGYDSLKGEVIYHDPAVRDGAYLRMKRAEFLDDWPLKGSPKRWTVIRMQLVGNRFVARPQYTGFTPADFAQHVRTLKQTRLPETGFHIVIQPPFVVVGDEPAARVRRRAEQTVKWSVDRLKDAYFKKDPDHIIEIWLFKNKRSYRRHTRAVFDDTPTTPYGYASTEHRALIMNIATGGGTLVHEIVHPYVAANFPACPSWLNEGLGSLYEQSGERRGRIVGLTNWRLPGLQKAIRNKRVPSFKTLTHTSEYAFYNKDPGTNYSQARYLCYYLQQKGLLRRYYHRFRQNHRTDPTGYRTLATVLGETDMAAFQKRWEQWVLALRFPPST
jgi:hypothetical protein